MILIRLGKLNRIWDSQTYEQIPLFLQRRCSVYRNPQISNSHSWSFVVSQIPNQEVSLGARVVCWSSYDDVATNSQESRDMFKSAGDYQVGPEEMRDV